MLSDDPAIRAVNVSLNPGTEPGEAYLDVKVDPSRRIDVYGSVATSRSPSVGGLRYSGGAMVRNLFFSGDTFLIDAGETGGLTDGTLTYSTPFLTPSTFLDGWLTREKLAVRRGKVESGPWRQCRVQRRATWAP